MAHYVLLSLFKGLNKKLRNWEFVNQFTSDYPSCSNVLVENFTFPMCKMESKLDLYLNGDQYSGWCGLVLSFKRFEICQFSIEYSMRGAVVSPTMTFFPLYCPTIMKLFYSFNDSKFIKSSFRSWFLSFANLEHKEAWYQLDKICNNQDNHGWQDAAPRPMFCLDFAV